MYRQLNLLCVPLSFTVYLNLVVILGSRISYRMKQIIALYCTIQPPVKE